MELLFVKAAASSESPGCSRFRFPIFFFFLGNGPNNATFCAVGNCRQRGGFNPLEAEEVSDHSVYQSNI